MKKPASRLSIESARLQKNQVRKVVGKAGEWVTVVLKNKKRAEKFEQRELQAPVPWVTYKKELPDGRRVMLETNVRLLHRVWRRPACGEGPIFEEEPKLIKPFVNVDVDGRADLKVSIPGVGNNIYWHDVVWFYFHNKTFKSYSDFKKSLSSSTGYRVDHVGGNNLVVDYNRLRLQPAGKAAQQGGQQKKRYRQSGVRVITERRLRAK